MIEKKCFITKCLTCSLFEFTRHLQATSSWTTATSRAVSCMSEDQAPARLASVHSPRVAPPTFWVLPSA